MIQRNFSLIKAEKSDKDIKSAFSMGLWTGSGLSSFVWLAAILGTLYYLGAFH